MQERRSNTRVRSFLGAKIVFNNRNASMDCLVRNLSATGVRIRMSETVVVPDEFELHIPQKGRSFRARMRWRTAEELGAEIQPLTQETDIAIESALRIRQLEAEKSALNARVAQLSSAE